MWLFVGLGNPGAEYAKNRHNIGFMVMDALADEFPIFTPFKAKFSGQMSEGRIGNSKVILLKPETYMNKSGLSVAKAAQFFKIPADRIVVFHDELDVPPSEVRVKLGGGNAGHNGLKSVQAQMGTADFWRVRIGIGRPQHKGDVSNYVLGNFSKEEMNWVPDVCDILAKESVSIISDSPKGYGIIIKQKLKKEEGA